MLSLVQSDNYLLNLAVSFLITMVKYSIFPVTFALIRKKPIKKYVYYLICFAVNVSLKVCVGLLEIQLFERTLTSESATPCFFWTFVFTYIGTLILKRKNMFLFSKEILPQDGNHSNESSEDFDILTSSLNIQENNNMLGNRQIIVESMSGKKDLNISTIDSAEDEHQGSFAQNIEAENKQSSELSLQTKETQNNQVIKDKIYPAVSSATQKQEIIAYCNKCGRPYKVGFDLFCSGCGNKLENDLDIKVKKTEKNDFFSITGGDSIKESVLSESNDLYLREEKDNSEPGYDSPSEIKKLKNVNEDEKIYYDYDSINDDRKESFLFNLIKNKRKTVRGILLSLLGVFVLCAGYITINYAFAQSYCARGDYEKAKRHYDIMLIAKLIFPDKYDKVYKEVMKQGNQSESDSMKETELSQNTMPVETNSNYTESEKTESSTERKESNAEIYNKAIKAYRESDIDTAQEYFTNVEEGYRRSKEFLVLIRAKKLVSKLDSNNYPISAFTKLAEYQQAEEIAKELIRIIEFEDSKEIILNNQIYLNYYLEGLWEESSFMYYFELLREGENSSGLPNWATLYNLPHNENGDTYSISNGVYITYNGDDKTYQFKFKIIDKNTISVFCYSNNKNYTLIRQK